MANTANFLQRITTARLILDPVSPSDGPALWSVVNSSRAHLGQWLPWIALTTTPEASQRFADACVQDWNARRALRWVIRTRQTETVVGMVGLERWVHANYSCELGYWLERNACGCGYMTEAATACLSYAFEQLGIHRVRCAAAENNHRSLAVISRLGFTREGLARHAELVEGTWFDHVTFGKLSTD